MRLIVRALPFGMLAVLAAALVAGCGGTAALDPVANAATKTADAGSFRFDFSVSFGVGGKSAEALTGEGAYDAAARRLRAALGVQGKKAEALVDLSSAPAVYLRPPAGEGGLPAGKQWVKLDLAQLAKQGGVDLGPVGSEQLDPRKAVDVLKQAGDSTKVGEETIDGVETTHYRVAIDAKKALEQQPDAQRKQAERALQLTGLDSVPLDVWVDHDGLLRRVSTEIGGADSFFSLGFRLDLSDYGSDVRVDLPPAGEVVDGAAFLPKTG